MKAASPIALSILAIAALAPTALADESTIRIGGYLCDAKQEQVAFLERRASGDNDIMAAEAVNKAAGRAACADYIAVEVIPDGEFVVVSNGMVFKTHRLVLLPERAERWFGSMTSSLEQYADKQDI